MVSKEDPLALGRVPGELDRRLDGLRPRVREDDSAHLRMAARQQLLGEQARQERGVHLHEVRQVLVDRVVQRTLDDGVRAPEAEDAESRQEVEVAAILLVVEVGALPSYVVPVEPDRSEHSNELRVDVARVQGEVPSRFAARPVQLECHRRPPCSIVPGREIPGRFAPALADPSRPGVGQAVDQPPSCTGRWFSRSITSVTEIRRDGMMTSSPSPVSKIFSYVIESTSSIVWKRAAVRQCGCATAHPGSTSPVLVVDTSSRNAGSAWLAKTQAGTRLSSSPR